jgi:hypothetical protein
MNLATKHPELFASAGGYDGTLMWLDFDDPSSPGANDDMYLTNSMFDPLFGKPRDIAYTKQYNPANNIAYASLATLIQLKRIRFMLHSGAVAASNRTVTQHVVDLLAAKGISNEFADIRLTPTASHNWFNADLHASVTLPIHWQKFNNAPGMLDLHFTSPILTQKLSGTVHLVWTRGLLDSALTVISLSSDAGESWVAMYTTAGRDSTYEWNTSLQKDGTRYMLQLMISGRDTLFGLLNSPLLTIDNPGNGLPDVTLNASVKHDTLRGVYDLHWTASDPEGDSLRLAIFVSGDSGATWETIAADLQNTGMFHWNTALAPNGSALILKLACSDGIGTTNVLVSPVVIANPRTYLSSASFRHPSGSGDGTIRAAIVDMAEITNSKYVVSFQTSTGGRLLYTVRDLTADAIKCSGIPVSTLGNEGPLFDGIRLIIESYEHPTACDDSSRWLAGASTLKSNTSLPFLILGADTLKGTPSSFDYEIRLYDHVVDTSSDYQGAIPVQTKFTIRRMQDGRQVKAAFNDFDNNGTISAFDELYLLEPQNDGVSKLTWYIFFAKGNPDIEPQAGDVDLIRILKPFAENDTITLTPVLLAIPENIRSAVPTKFVLYQNYPNPFNPSTIIRYDLPYRSRVSLDLYSVLGQKVRMLFAGEQEPGSHEVVLDGSTLAGGVYFYRVSVAAVGAQASQSVRKLLLLK